MVEGRRARAELQRDQILGAACRRKVNTPGEGGGQARVAEEPDLGGSLPGEARHWAGKKG
ncbi:hypothetical protein TIFTF001_008650 [Ficus carica]|uniref:Uncharacterized protein n=1 Tax=Ficus carica TaxID=3494 RepID=A0AA87ZSJ9_FICCA|nr:hypothetical protein TIFTF001_008650 [Ficus carica]